MARIAGILNFLMPAIILFVNLVGINSPQNIPLSQTPVANNDNFGMNINGRLVISAPGVLFNDIATPFSELVAIKLSDPKYGEVDLYSDGSFSYIPELNYTGTDSFTYKVNDGHSDSNAAIVSLTIYPLDVIPQQPIGPITTPDNLAQVSPLLFGITVTPVSPMNGETDVATSPMLRVNVTDANNNSLQVSFYGRQKTSATAQNFTLVSIPDTQYYTINTGGYVYFNAMTTWMANNQTAQNLVFVTHTGDITQNGDNDTDDSEWMIADTAMSILERDMANPLDDVSYSISPGNHESLGTVGGVLARYDAHFPISRFSNKPYYGGHYGSNNDNSYSLFTSGGMRFIVINLACTASDPNSAVLNWADGLLKDDVSQRGIVVCHDAMDSSGAFQSAGQKVFNALSDNSNWFLLLCGHAGVARRVDTGADGHSIYSFEADYSGYANGGNSYIRLMQFQPDSDQIQVKTFSPMLNGGAGGYNSDPNHQFIVPYNMLSPDFTLLGSVTVPSGSDASLTWDGLANNTEYEWYAVARNTTSNSASDVLSFTTTANPSGTETATMTNTPGSATSTPTATATPSPPASSTPTRTVTPSATASATPLPPASSTPTQTITPSPTASATLSPPASSTPTHTNTPSPTATATLTPPASSTPTHTTTPSPTATATPSPLASSTPTQTATLSPTMDPNSFTFASWSDAQNNGQNLPVLSNQIAIMNPAFTIFNGDLENSGFDQLQMDTEVVALNGGTGHDNGLYNKTFFVRGNADNHTVGSDALWEEYLVTANRTLPLGVTNYISLDGNSTYLTYSFDYGNSRFIGADVPGNASLLTTTIAAFIDQRLTDAENIGLTHAFLFFHGPEYCVESVHCGCSAATDSTCTPTRITDLINRHPIVSATFHGHEHVLAWVHMSNARVSGLTHEYEEFISSPSDIGAYNNYLFPDRVDYANLQNAPGFAMITVSGQNFTVNLFRRGNMSPVWSSSFIKGGYSTSTATFTPYNTATPTITATPVSLTSTPTPTSTSSPIPTTTNTPTPTGTNTSTATSTSSSTPTSLPSPTTTQTASATIAMTSTPTASGTPTPIPTATNTPLPTSTNTVTSSPTASGTPTPIPTATNTPLPTSTNTVTSTPTASGTPTPVPTSTNTPLPTATSTITLTPTATNTRTPASSPTNTRTPTATRTARPTRTSVSTRTATATYTPTATFTPSPTLIYPPVFADNFDPSTEQWSHLARTGVDDWQLSSARALSPVTSYYCSEPASIKDDYLVTRAIVVPTNAVLSFWQTYQMEAGRDGAVIEISTDNGSTFTDLGSRITADQYDGTISNRYGSTIGGRSAWTGGRLGTWSQVVVDLSTYAGQSVIIRFRLASDNRRGGYGWYIDDVMLYSQ